MRKTFVFAVLSLFATFAFAEEQKKPLSPAASAKCVIAGKNIAIDYSAPSKRDRKIMGELVPYGKLWRTGANQATTLKTDADLMIGSLHVPAGEYLLFTIPNEKEWTLVVSKQKGLWGTGGYDEKQDLGRVAMTVAPVKNTVETFKIDVKPASGNKGTLTMAWENTQASVPVMVH